MHTSKSLTHHWLGAAFVSLCAFSVLLSLGLWQLNRKHWKEEILTRITQQIASDPLPLPPECHWHSWETKIGEYRHIRVRGTFLHRKELLFYTPSPLDENAKNTPGFFVLTPLEQEDGSIVIVNRGFIPESQKHSIERHSDENVTLVGLTRRPQKRGWLMPDNDPEKNAWFIQDPRIIAQTHNLKRVAPFLIDTLNTHPSSHPRGSPRGRNKKLSIPNDHLGYALTWFALAGALVVICAFWIREQRKTRKNSGAQKGYESP